MTDHSRQDRTRSPSPNELARLYQREAELEHALYGPAYDERVAMENELHAVRRQIKRACGDRETI